MPPMPRRFAAGRQRRAVPAAVWAFRYPTTASPPRSRSFPDNTCPSRQRRHAGRQHERCLCFNELLDAASPPIPPITRSARRPPSPRHAAVDVSRSRSRSPRWVTRTTRPREQTSAITPATRSRRTRPCRCVVPLTARDIAFAGDPLEPGSRSSASPMLSTFIAGGSDIWNNRMAFLCPCQIEGDLRLRVRVAGWIRKPPTALPPSTCAKS